MDVREKYSPEKAQYTQCMGGASFFRNKIRHPWSKREEIHGHLLIQMEKAQSIFEELCLPHLDAAYNLARLLVGRDEEAQEVVQEAYIRALKGFKGFRGDNARAWLLALVRNAAYSSLKRHAKQPDLIPLDPMTHVRTREKPLSESAHGKSAQQLDVALKRLPVEMREILFLHEIEGWSYKKLSSTLNIPPDTVMSRLSRARQRLLQELAGIRQTELKDEL
jgi:RNA polymerase sigma factor (sigma-70 family)